MMINLKQAAGFLILCIAILGIFPKVSIAGSDQFTIDGKVNLDPGTIVVLSHLTPENFQALDTVELDANGKFEFSGSEEQSTLYYLTFKTANPPGVPLIVENGAKISLDITAGDDYQYTVKGGKYNASMQKLHTLYTGYDRQIKTFNAEVESLDPASITDEIKQTVQQDYQKLLFNRTMDIEEFVMTAEASPAIYFAVRFLFAKPESRMIFIAADRLQEAMPESEYTKQLQEYKEMYGPLAEGAVAPNIKLPNPEGDSIELHSLKGKVVLIDFWASWCGPCRQENPNVRALYKEYHDKGFEIYAVSLDKNLAQWEAAIQKDQLPWLHVSDLMAWNSSAARLYDVHSIPQTYLIDKDGRIYKVGLRSHDLEPVLDYLLN
ncbi:AhpC/TSA family protein [bacterium]|nr:AhpC/TSA family protein [bacterium]